MIRKFSFAALATILFASIAWSAGRTPTQLVRMNGWVVDSEYGKKHAGPEHAADILEARERGYDLVLWVAEKEREFVLADQDGATQYVGQYVSVIAALTEDGKLNVGTWKQVKPQPTP